MKIDEAAFERAMAMPGRDGPGMFREFLECYLAALPPAEPGRDRIEPSDGKLRVRVCLAVGSNDYWHAVGGYGWSDGHCRAEAMDPFDHDDDPVAIKWIEAFVDKYVPPAEETVQGREVDHG